MTSERPQLDSRHVSLRNLFSLLRNLGAQLNLLISKIFSSSNCQSSNMFLFHPKESTLHAPINSRMFMHKQIHDRSVRISSLHRRAILYPVHIHI